MTRISLRTSYNAKPELRPASPRSNLGGGFEGDIGVFLHYVGLMISCSLRKEHSQFKVTGL